MTHYIYIPTPDKSSSFPVAFRHLFRGAPLNIFPQGRIGSEHRFSAARFLVRCFAIPNNERRLRIVVMSRPPAFKRIESTRNGPRTRSRRRKRIRSSSTVLVRVQCSSTIKMLIFSRNLPAAKARLSAAVRQVVRRQSARGCRSDQTRPVYGIDVLRGE